MKGSAGVLAAHHERVSLVGPERAARIRDVRHIQVEATTGAYGRGHAHAVARAGQADGRGVVAELTATHVSIEPVGAVIVRLVDVRQPVAREVGKHRRKAVGVVLADAEGLGDVLEVIVAEVFVQAVVAGKRPLDPHEAWISGQLLGPIAQPDAGSATAVVIGERHAAHDVAGRIEA